MERVQSCFLNILRHALRGETVPAPLGLEAEAWAELMDLAQCHHVLPMVYEAVHALPELKELPFVPGLKRQVRQQVMVQAQKTCDFLELNQRLQAAGVKPLVVKGILCRNLYPKPDHRISSDEDVLIPPDAVDLCHAVLTDFGMATTEAPENFGTVYEIPYLMQGNPLYIELHRYLFPPESEAYGDLNRFFTDVFDHAVAETIQGVPVYTMGYTEHLFYLICHAFKHFLHSGFGIRQVCDIVMFANAYGSQIDWRKVLVNCQAIRAERFTAALFRIGEKHLVFDAEKARYPDFWQRIDIDETAMLEDLLSSGLYGGATMSRKHSSSITLDAVASQKQGKRSGNALLLSLFPPAKSLENGYPYLKDKPYLLPAAWASRIWKYRKETRNAADASDALKIGNQRIALLKEYGIIE